MKEYWQCPVCTAEGYKINQHFGYCVRKNCVGPCINKNIQDVGKNNIRKLENLIVDQRLEKGKESMVTTYYTDGSGKK